MRLEVKKLKRTRKVGHEKIEEVYYVLGLGVTSAAILDIEFATEEEAKEYMKTIFKEK